MRTCSVICLLAMTAFAAPALAQNPLTVRQLDSGTVVRITLPSGRRDVGRLVAPFGADSAQLRYCPYFGAACARGGGQPVQAPALGVARLEVRHGTHARTGAVLGAIIGAPVLLLGLSQVDRQPSGWTAAALFTVGILCSAGWGALVGSWLDSWEPALSEPPRR